LIDVRQNELRKSHYDSTLSPARVGLDEFKVVIGCALNPIM
jgi:hypothetical protein